MSMIGQRNPAQQITKKYHTGISDVNENQLMIDVNDN